MGYETISLSDEAYEKPASLKRNGESFTDVILRLCSKSPRKPLSSFAASWTMGDEEEKKIFRGVAEVWRKHGACLDADFPVALLRGRPEAVKKAEEYDSSGVEVSTTSINAFEIYLGAYRSKHAEKNLKQADELLGSIRVLGLDAEASRKSSKTLSRLLTRGLSNRVRDAVIAGISLSNGCALVTRNLAHFKRVMGLSVESWQVFKPGDV